MAGSLVDILESFNRKERHILWEQATGTRDKVSLSGDLRVKLAAATALDIPCDALVLVDFHLNWLYGALLVWRQKLGPEDEVHRIAEAASNRVENKHRQPYEHNQEDIDMLVAYETGGKPQVILVEAKGYTSWDNKQMSSKLDRLDLIVADADPNRAVDYRLVLASFNKWEKHVTQWEPWVADGESEPAHVALRKPAGRRTVEECTSAGGRQQGDGKGRGGWIHLQ